MNQQKSYNRIVVKIGTTSLTHPNGKLNLRRIERLAWVLSDLRNQGKEVVLVSSGAIAVGADRMGYAERPRDTRGKQAASAVGQAVLMQIYENFFMRYNQMVAQILMTKDVYTDERRHENAQNTFSALFEMGVIPIVNENDTVSTDELEFSDNDALSACVATLVEADLLIILSDIKGLYSSDPKLDENAEFITHVYELTDDIMSLGQCSAGNLGTGGMATKLAAAKAATDEGIAMVIATGEEPSIIFDILDGKNAGTFFHPKIYES